ncbi:MAG TPA: hypothetical protein VFD42_04455 [Chloroflexota bacterium]|nr:hypothetical protein [Chloroflexota bacterium]
MAISPVVAGALKRAALAAFIAGLTVFMDELRKGEERQRTREQKR